MFHFLDRSLGQWNDLMQLLAADGAMKVKGYPRQKLRHIRKALGSGMRQIGLPGCGLFSLIAHRLMSMARVVVCHGGYRGRSAQPAVAKLSVTCLWERGACKQKFCSPP